MTYNKLVNGKVIPMTGEEIAERHEEEAAFLAKKQDYETNHKYKDDRAKEYPPLSDLADALVKINAGLPGGDEQLSAYVSSCIAVKAKYPKPQGE